METYWKQLIRRWIGLWNTIVEASGYEKGNDIKRLFVLYIQMAKTWNIPQSYPNRVKMRLLHEEWCSFLQIATIWGCMHTTARVIIKILQQSVTWMTKLGVDDPSAVHKDTIVFCFACVEPTGRKQLQNWSDSCRSRQVFSE